MMSLMASKSQTAAIHVSQRNQVVAFVVNKHSSDLSTKKSTTSIAGRHDRKWTTQRFSSTSSNESSSSPLNEYWTHTLNSPKHVMAPMVAQSDLPFRLLCRKYDTNLCYTQMIHSQNFNKSETFQKNHLDTYPTTKSSKLHVSESGWNMLHDLDWKIFEQKCTFLQQKQNQVVQNGKSFEIDQNEMYNLMQICKDDHDRFIKTNKVDDNMDGMDDNMGASSAYGLYYERLPTMHDYPSSLLPVNNHNPLVVQLAGHDPQTMTDAAKQVLSLTNNNDSDEEYNGPVSGIDINCGCPQGIARKGNYGAFLMENDFTSVCQTIEALKANLPSNVGVSIKMRIPPEYNMNLEKGREILQQRIHAMMDSGIDLLTVHGRTLHENKTKVRECNWNSILDARSTIQEYQGRGRSTIPLLANGGIEYYHNILECLDHTKANGVMSSETLLENPSLFVCPATNTPQENFKRQMQYCHEYLDLCILFPPIPGSLGKKGGSFNVIRGHLFKMLYRYLEEQPDLRTMLGEPKRMTTVQSAKDLLYELERRYDDVIDMEYQRLKVESGNTQKGRTKSWVDLKSSHPDSSWYRRHRDAIANNKMKIRGAKADNDANSSLSAEEKKRIILERISKLKEQKLQKKKRQQHISSV